MEDAVSTRDLRRMFTKTRVILGGPKARLAVERGLNRVAEEVMADSNDNYVPVDTGALKSSGYVAEPVRTDGETTIVLGYGGPGIDYALEQHENLELNHHRPEHDGEGNRPGQAKYLSTPLRKRQGDVATEVSRELRRAIRTAA